MPSQKIEWILIKSRRVFVLMFYILLLVNQNSALQPCVDLTNTGSIVSDLSIK